MRCIAGLVLTSAVLSAAAPAAGQAVQLIDRVEEDWRLVVATPDVEGVGPQITTSMCPVADRTQAPFVALDLNYREYPSFVAGGWQAQVWSGDQLVQYSSGGKTDQFATANETVTWTQRMSLGGGQVSYSIPASSSTTWGTFGQNVSVNFSTSLLTLAGYSPSTSVANSGVSWQVNNVQDLTLVAIRYYSGGTLLATDSTARQIVSNGAVVNSTSGCGPGADAQATRLGPTPPFAPMPAMLASRRERRGAVAVG
jgi:hypothetical protein